MIPIGLRSRANRQFSFLYGCCSLFISSALLAAPPSGTDGSVSIQEDGFHQFQPADFGFTDPLDSPPHLFSRLKITSLPGAGVLTADGVAVQAGDFVQMQPRRPGDKWLASESSGYYAGLASSTDGTLLYAVDNSARIKFSSDAGRTWDNTGPPMGWQLGWQSVACSGNGEIIAATTASNFIILSRDGGASWHESAHLSQWKDVSCSATGSVIAAVTWNTTGFGIYVSQDTGQTWVGRTAAAERPCIAVSGDGASMYTATGSHVLKSIDGGMTWASNQVMEFNVSDIAVSHDGMRIYALGDGDRVSRSADGGSTWTRHSTGATLNSVSCSSDGSRVAVASGGQVLFSDDAAQTWRTSNDGLDWRQVAVSPDGKRAAASIYYAGIRVTSTDLPEVVYSPPGDAAGANLTSFTFQVEDSAQTAALDLSPNTINIHVTQVADPPVLRSYIPKQSAEIGIPFSFSFSAETFSDADPTDTISYSAKLDNGSPLPAWLSFAPGSRMFSGTPVSADSGLYSILVTATDTSQWALQASTVFTLDVYGLPSGTNKTISTEEDVTCTINGDDFGFHDSLELVPDRFFMLKISTLPSIGSLEFDGIPVQAGQTIWMPTGSALWGSGNPVRGNWIAACMTADGALQLAADEGGRLYVSPDSGCTWNHRGPMGVWRAVTCARKSGKLFAIDQLRQVYASVDFGQSWSLEETFPEIEVLASSADGVNLVAARSGSRIFFSRDGGATWLQSGESRAWRHVACSEDATRVAVSDDTSLGGGHIYVSSSGGDSWLLSEAPRSDRNALEVSADGLKLCAIREGGVIEESSDGGVTWRSIDSPAGISHIAASPDGNAILAFGLQTYLTLDRGRIWLPQTAGPESGATLRAGACSDNAEAMLVAPSAGYTLGARRSSLSRLTYTPPPDAFGTAFASFDFQVMDISDAVIYTDPSPNTMTFNVTPADDAPRGGLRSPLQSAFYGVPFIWQVPTGSFTDPDPATVLTYSAGLADGGALPPWLSFNPTTRTLSGTPDQSDRGVLRIRITATDSGLQPRNWSDTLDLHVVAGAPTGHDFAVNLQEDGSFAFTPSDFGFSSPNAPPLNQFSMLEVVTIQGGQFRFNDLPVLEGQRIPLHPRPGNSWQESGTQRNWNRFLWGADATSAFGAANDGLYRWTSGNNTWINLLPGTRFRDVAASDDGSVIAAAGSRGYITLSTDAGATWLFIGPESDWIDVTCSADGRRLVAAEPGGKMLISQNGGKTWALGPNRPWRGVSSSADGQFIYACGYGYGLFISRDAGATWEISNAGTALTGVQCSHDGSKVYSNSIYSLPLLVSDNYGKTWQSGDIADEWDLQDVSASGQTILALKKDVLYQSHDWGTSWLPVAGGVTAPASVSVAGDQFIARSLSGKAALSSPELGVFRMVPPSNTIGSPHSSVIFKVADSSLPSGNFDLVPDTLTVNVAPVNDPPVARVTLVNTTAAEYIFYSATFSNSFTHVDAGDPLTFSAAMEGGGPLPAWLSLNPQTATFSGTPSAMNAGTHRILLTATDSGSPPLSATLTVVLKVNSPDSPPQGTAFTRTISEDTTYAFTAADFEMTDPLDFPAHNLTRIRITNLPSRGQLRINGAAAVAGSYATMSPVAAGIVFRQRETSRTWRSMFVSGNGERLAAAANGGKIYVSSDRGSTWQARAIDANWYSTAGSADGQKMVATVSDGGIHVSSDGGLTWTERLPGAKAQSVTCSSDGMRMAAATSTGVIQTSADGGLSWVASSPADLGYFIAASRDGMKIVAVKRSGRLAFSENRGLSWTTKVMSGELRSVACSADFSTILVCHDPGTLYLSRDGGTSFEPRETSANWSEAWISPDGRVIAAAAAVSGRFVISTDAGETWRQRSAGFNPGSVAFSDDLSLFAVANRSGPLFISTPLTTDFFQFVPAADQNGTPYTSFNFQVEDDGSTAQALDGSPNLATINVAPVNDAPTLLPLSSMVLQPGAGSFSVPLGGIGSGGGEAQSLTVTAVSDNPGFIPNPTVSYTSPAATGSLTIIPGNAANAFARITVTVTDSAGTAGGGVDTFSRTFTVSRLPEFQVWAAGGGLSGDPAANGGSNLLRFAFGLPPQSVAVPELIVGQGNLIQRGYPAIQTDQGNPATFAALFGRRKNSGLSLRVQFSSDLTDWENGPEPVVIADDGLVEACRVPFPGLLMNGRNPRFFRVSASSL